MPFEILRALDTFYRFIMSIFSEIVEYVIEVFMNAFLYLVIHLRLVFKILIGYFQGVKR